MIVRVYAMGCRLNVIEGGISRLEGEIAVLLKELAI